MAIIPGENGLEVTIIHEPSRERIPIQEHLNKLDRAPQGSRKVIKYIESRSDSHFGIRVQIPADNFHWQGEAHFRIEVYTDRKLRIQDDLSDEVIRLGVDKTYGKATRGPRKAFYFKALQPRNEEDEPIEAVPDTDYGNIDVYFYPLLVEEYVFKNRKASRSIDISAGSSINTKPYIMDFRKRPTHECTIRSPSPSKRYEDERTPVYGLRDQGGGAYFRFQFKCRSKAMLREMRLLAPNRQDRAARTRHQEQVKQQIRGLPSVKEEQEEDEVVVVSHTKKESFKNTPASRAKVRQEAMDTARRIRRNAFRRANQRRFVHGADREADGTNVRGSPDGLHDNNFDDIDTDPVEVISGSEGQHQNSLFVQINDESEVEEAND